LSTVVDRSSAPSVRERHLRGYPQF